MTRHQKNYFIYLLMLLLFGGLIYVAIHGGERFDSISAGHTPAEQNAWQMFCSTFSDSLSGGLVILLIQIVVVLFAVRVFSYLFRYIGQPGVIGEIVAGIVLGPSLLGYFFPDVFGWLFRPDSLTNLELISQLGLILFMFVIGMELDFGVIRKKINETLVISHAGILVPFFLGIIASYWVYEEYAASQTSFLPFALFIGISMSITAFPVLARIIQERNMTKSSVGILSIASAANDDVTAWCLLAVVIAIAKAGTMVSALFAIVLTAVYILIMFLLVRPFLRKVGEVYATGEVINKTFVSFIFLILVISATLTELIGIHALFGAFMAGVVMPPNIGFRKVMMEKVEDVALVFFLPLFFAYTGLHTEIGLIDTPQLWLICLLFIGVAVLGKFGGCAIAARLVGESWRDSLTIGTLMNTRGLMELVALNIGYEMGVLPPPVFVILVIMALVTSFMTTPMLSLIELIYKKNTKQDVVKRKLVLCFGRPESGRELLLVLGLLFGRRLKKYHLIAAHYTEGTDLNPIKAEQYERDSFKPLRREAALLKVKVEERYKVTDKVRDEIVHLGESEQADLMLIGSKSSYIDLSSGLLQRIKENSFQMVGTLFRERTNEIVEQIDTPLGIFVNRLDSGRPSRISFLLGGDLDDFLLPYIDTVLESGSMPVRLFLFQNGEYPVKRWMDEYQETLEVIEYEDFSQLSFDKDSLLVVGYEVSEEMVRNVADANELPSLLIMKKAIK